VRRSGGSFFFSSRRRHTRCLSDWSSDVCSSDLLALLAPGAVHPDPSSFNNGDNTASGGRPYINGNREQSNNFLLDGMDNNQVSRSEERRVGKECRDRWSRYH